MTGLYILLAVTAALLILFAVMAARACAVKGGTAETENYNDPRVDTERAVKKLQGAIKIPTVSMQKEEYGPQPFYDFRDYLEKQFPLFHSTAERHIVNGFALMYKIEGTDKTLKPACFLGHQDVVPADNEGWTHPPFDGFADNEYIWGRGSFDMKGQLISCLEAAETLLENGFKPRRTMYFCFGHDEEFSGKDGATAMASVFKEENISLEYILDEGMTLINAELIGIKEPLALIGACEKGYANIKITVHGNGGHAAMPPAKTSAVLLAEGIKKLNRHQMKAYYSEAVTALIKKVCPRAKFLFRLIMANMWFWKPILKPVLVKTDPSIAALMRTTMAITVLEAAPAANVIPKESSAVVNCRINTGETSTDVLRHIKKVLGDKFDVEILPTGLHEPTSMSNLNSLCWRMLEKTASEIWHGAPCAPFPFVAGTDSKYYEGCSDCIFKFSPHITDAEYRAGMHNVNERFKISDLEGDIKFYIRFMRNTCE